MSRCLTERTLILLQAGEGGAEERAHLRACPSCAERYRALEDDLGVIADALRAGPPPVAARPARLRWRAVGALAASVALAVGAAWMWRAARVAPPAGVDVTAQVEDLAGTLFAAPEAAAAGDQSAAYEAAAFDEDDELALLFEGP